MWGGIITEGILSCWNGQSRQQYIFCWSDCRVRWACGWRGEGSREKEGVAKTILGPMKTDPVLINTGRPLFLLAARRQTFWPALDDAWSKIGHHTAQQWSQWWHHHCLQCALPSVLLRTKSSRHAAREADVTLCLGNIKTNKCSPSPEKAFNARRAKRCSTKCRTLKNSMCFHLIQVWLVLVLFFVFLIVYTFFCHVV